jgi:hypothetical protein
VPLIVTRPLATPLGLRPAGTLRPLEDILALLTRAGFSGPDALHIYRALFGFLHGHVLNELQELVENPDETDDLLRLGLHRLPITEFPLLRSLAPALAAYDGAAELERGLDILLEGLTTTLAPEPTPRQPAAARQPASCPAVSSGGSSPKETRDRRPRRPATARPPDISNLVWWTACAYARTSAYVVNRTSVHSSSSPQANARRTFSQPSSGQIDFPPGGAQREQPPGRQPA